MKRTVQSLVLLALAVPVISSAQAQKNDNRFCPAESQLTAVPNRPTFSSTAETTQCGAFEIEYGIEAANGHQDVNGLLKFGLLKNLELWLPNLPFVRNDGVSGFGDLGAGFKYQIISQRKLLPTFSILYTASFPTASHDLGSGAVNHSIFALASKDFGNNHFDWNEGITLAGRTSGASGFDRSYFSALDYSHPLRGKWSVAIEIAGFSRLNAETPASMTILGAATYNVSSRLVLDAGAYYNVLGNLPRVTGFAGVTYSVADLYHRHHQQHAHN